MRHTKIIATLGPSSRTDAALDELVAAGVDLFRFNLSHGSHDEQAELYHRARAAAERGDRAIGTLLDLSGPKMRTGRLAGRRPIELKPGDGLRIVVGDGQGEPGRVFTDASVLPQVVKPGDRLLLDDGRIELAVLETGRDEIRTSVVDGGLLEERKGINAPGVAIPLDAPTAKDIDDLRFGLDLGVDIIAQSFVRDAADVRRTRDLMTAAGHGETPLMAKIERPEAIGRLDGILDICDAVMVARGDLGLEMPLEAVPRVQKEITRFARRRGVPVVVATQVLESMRTQPRPTRAEVSDAANAVDDGVDAIMLAGETAAGTFPARAVRALAAVIRETEAVSTPSELRLRVTSAQGHERALCEAAVTLAEGSGAAAIVAMTRSGRTPSLLAAMRTRPPILAVTDSLQVARRLTLFRGVMPVVASLDGHPADTYVRLARRLAADGLVAADAVVVFVSVAADLTHPDTNLVKLMRA